MGKQKVRHLQRKPASAWRMEQTREEKQKQKNTQFQTDEAKAWGFPSPMGFIPASYNWVPRDPYNKPLFTEIYLRGFLFPEIKLILDRNKMI